MPRKNRRRGGCGRSLGLMFIVLVFACAAFLLSCRPNNSINAPSSRPSVSTHVRQSDQPQHAADREEPERVRQSERSSEPPPKAEETVRPVPKPTVVFGDLHRGDTESSHIALTFDAGASAAPTPRILDVLAKHGVHATFFLTGKWMEKNPKLTRRIADEGHEIGNHTYLHKRLTTLSDGEIAEEVEKTEQLVLDLTGRSTKPLLRFPYGDRNEHVIACIESLGYRSIYWDVDSWDSVKEGITSEEIKARVLGKARNGSVILLHCGSSATADALDSLLTELKTAGYQQVTVGELLQHPQRR